MKSPDKQIEVFNTLNKRVEMWDAWETGVPGLVVVRWPSAEDEIRITHERSGMAIGPSPGHYIPINGLPLSELIAFAATAGADIDWSFDVGDPPKVPTTLHDEWKSGCAVAWPAYDVPKGVRRCKCLDGCSICAGSGWIEWVREGCGGDCCDGNCKMYKRPWARPEAGR